MRLSTRNQLKGTITEVDIGAVMAIVKIRLDGGDSDRHLVSDEGRRARVRPQSGTARNSVHQVNRREYWRGVSTVANLRTSSSVRSIDRGPGHDCTVKYSKPSSCWRPSLLAPPSPRARQKL